jgi:hypothetical protein
VDGARPAHDALVQAAARPMATGPEEVRMGMTARRVVAASALWALLGWAGGCGDDATEAGSSTTAATTTTTTSTTVEPASLEEALAAWAAAEDVDPYLGPCPVEFDESFPLEGICSVELESEEGRTVQGLGPPFSEIVVYLQLEEGAEGWAVADEYAPAEPYDLSDAPSWVPSSTPAD